MVPGKLTAAMASIFRHNMSEEEGKVLDDGKDIV